MQDNNDTILNYKDSILFNGNKLRFLREKKFEKNDKISKYIVDNIYNSSNLYLNKENKLIMIRSISSNIVVEYYNKGEDADLHSLISADSNFFSSEW